MAFNLIESVQNIFSNDITAKASSLIGENESNVKTALSGIIPSVFTGLLNQAGSGNPQNILHMVKDAANSIVPGNFSGALSNSSLLSKGSEILKFLFGDKLGNVSNMISSFAGIRESSASSLMSMAAPAALGVLGRHVSDTNMNAGGLMSFLNSQKDNILGALPSGLNLAGALGLGSLTGITSKLSGKLAEIKDAFSNKSERAIQDVSQKTKSNRWVPLLLAAVVILGLLFFMGKGCGSDKPESVAVTTDTAKAIDTVTPQPLIPVRESMKVKLPDGTELNAFKGGIEDQLVIFLNDPSTQAGKNVWFDFDNLNFTTGSAVITEESKPQIQNIVAILKAFPKVKIKIGGYTDKTGDSLANLKLSQDRANAVSVALKSDGANKSQITGAEGYGPQFAKVDMSASDEERKKDRRIAVGIRAK